MADVEQLELTMAAAGLMRGYRQSKRIWRRYRDDGDARLMHQLRGKLGDINVKRFKTMKAALQEEHSVAPATERTQTNPFAAPGVNIYKTRDGYTPEPELPGVQRRRQNDEAATASRRLQVLFWRSNANGCGQHGQDTMLAR